MWTLHKQQQHCGAQLHARRPGKAPAEAVADRAAQEHDRAGVDPGDGAARPGDYPASALENRDETSPAREASVAWDEVVQPERRHERDELPLPDGK